MKLACVTTILSLTSVSAYWCPWGCNDLAEVHGWKRRAEGPGPWEKIRHHKRRAEEGEEEMIGRRMEMIGRRMEHPLETRGLSAAPWLKEEERERQTPNPEEECSRLVEYCRPKGTAKGTSAVILPGCERFEEIAERGTDPDCDCDLLASDMHDLYTSVEGSMPQAAGAGTSGELSEPAGAGTSGELSEPAGAGTSGELSEPAGAGTSGELSEPAGAGTSGELSELAGAGTSGELSEPAGAGTSSGELSEPAGATSSGEPFVAGAGTSSGEPTVSAEGEGLPAPEKFQHGSLH